jgi:hypothetical protein
MKGLSKPDGINLKLYKIVFRKFSENKVLDFINLSKIEYGMMKSVTDTDHVRCKHLKAPYGISTAINLEHAGKVVGRAMVQPRLTYLYGQKISTAFITDVLIHPDFRRPASNFISLMTSVKEIQGFPLVFHTSNNTTEKIYKDLLRFKCLFSLSGFGFLLNLRKIACQVLKIESPLFDFFSIPYKFLVLALSKTANIFFDYKLTKEKPEDSLLDKFILKEAIKNHCEMIRDSKFLKWRFIQSTVWQAQILYLYKDSKLFGYVVLQNVELEGIQFTVVMDFAISKEVNAFQLLCLRFSIIQMALDHDSDAIFTLLNPLSSSSKRFVGFPWIKIPERYLPHKTPIFIHIKDPAIVNLENQTGFHITLADLDYF